MSAWVLILTQQRHGESMKEGAERNRDSQRTDEIAAGKVSQAAASVL